MNLKHFATTVSMLALTQLAGCGGDGGGEPAPVMKGIWSGTTGTISTSAIVLANGDSWVVSTDATGSKLAALPLALTGSTFTGSGKQYQGSSSEAATVSGSFVQKTSVTGSMVATSGTNNFSLTYDSRSDTPVTVANAVGTWKATYNAGAITTTLAIASTTGVLSGSSSTGCTYVGTLLPRTDDPAIYKADFTETCLTGTPTVLSGVATLNIAKTGLSIVVVSADKNTGTLFAGVKQ
jgi:hypothetical protein